MKLLLTAAAILPLASSVFALDGIVGMHDPSTIMFCDGKYYVFGTGNNGLMSQDGWTWTNGVARTGGGVAADMIHIGDRYYMTYATSAAQPKAEVHMTWTPTLDPSSPNMKFEDLGVVASSDGIEECNAIDPALLLDPTDGKLWLSYGSYYGFIRLVELDPKTGKRVNPNDKPKDLAVNCEASEMIYHDGWYYLLATHGSCCRGADSGYNIRCGRSRSVLGPYLDNMGVDMIQGGGKLVCGSGGRFVGAGHFGLLDCGEGVKKFSMHWEADLDRAAPACWTFVRCFSSTAGRWLARTSRRARMKSNPFAPAPPWNWLSKACLWVDAVPEAVAPEEGAGSWAAALAGAEAAQTVRRDSGPMVLAAWAAWATPMPWRRAQTVPDAEAAWAVAACLAARALRFRRRTSRKFRRTGLPATLTPAWPITCVRPSKNGPSSL